MTTDTLVEIIRSAPARNVREVVEVLRKAFPELWPAPRRRLVVVAAEEPCTSKK